MFDTFVQDAVKWLEMFLDTRWGKYALIVFFFTLIIAYLRLLFGPKGFFREKKWDDWNEAAVKEEERKRAAQKLARQQADDARNKDKA